MSISHYVHGVETDLEEAAEVLQGALGPEEAPGQNRADLFTHRVEVGDEAVRHLEETAEGCRRKLKTNTKQVTALSLSVCIYHLSVASAVFFVIVLLEGEPQLQFERAEAVSP